MTHSTIGDSCPPDANTVAAWAEGNGISLDHAWRRFTQFLVLRCLAEEPELSSRLVLHGGTACWWRYGTGRVGKDVDFCVSGHIDGRDDCLRPALLEAVQKSLSLHVRKFCPDFDQHRSMLSRFAKIELYGPAIAPNGETVVIDSDKPFRVAEASYIVGCKLEAMIAPQHKRHVPLGSNFYDLGWILMHWREQIDAKKVLTITEHYKPTIGRLRGNLLTSLDTARVNALSAEYQSLEILPSRHLPLATAVRLVTEYVDDELHRHLGA